MKCGLCGYFEAVKASHGEDGKFVGYVHEVRSGAGALFYHYQGAPGYRTYCLHSEEEVAAAERWLSERLSRGHRGRRPPGDRLFREFLRSAQLLDEPRLRSIVRASFLQTAGGEPSRNDSQGRGGTSHR